MPKQSEWMTLRYLCDIGNTPKSYLNIYLAEVGTLAFRFIVLLRCIARKHIWSVIAQMRKMESRTSPSANRNFASRRKMELLTLVILLVDRNVDGGCTLNSTMCSFFATVVDRHVDGGCTLNSTICSFSFEQKVRGFNHVLSSTLYL